MQKRYPDQPQQLVEDVIFFLNNNGSLRKIAADNKFSPTYLSSVKSGRYPPAERLAALVGWKLERIWTKYDVGENTQSKANAEEENQNQ